MKSDLLKLKELYEKTVQGTWRARDDLPGDYPCCILINNYENVGPMFKMANAEFVATVHNAMPEILELIEKTQQEPCPYCMSWAIRSDHCYKFCPDCGKQIV